MTLVFLSLNSSEVTHPAASVALRIGIHNLFPESGFWQSDSEVVIWVTGKVHDDRYWVTG
ncbi:MAG: hypothetical protein RL569_734, partial [Actinomycetota bacterium]